MVYGAIGPAGQLVRKHAAQDNRRELAHVPTPHQLTVEDNALDKLKRQRTATLSHAQVCSDVTQVCFACRDLVCHVATPSNASCWVKRALSYKSGSQ